MRFENAVIARRFTIICLMAMIFGLGFAALIEGASRPARAWETGKLQICPMPNGTACFIKR
jgi:hypothetical protein